MRPVVLDFESYYADDYTLTKMTTESYVRDPRFEIHGAAIKWSKDTLPQWYDARELAYVLKQEDWSDVLLIHHHAQFDGFILKHRYGVLPRMFGCTLSMARLLLGNHLSVSLDAVRKHFGMPPKTTPYNLFRGKHWNEMTSDVHRQIAEGAIDEVESIWKIFGLLLKAGFPVAELDVVDSVVRMFIDPVLELDSAMLADLWECEAKRKLENSNGLGIDPAELRSTDLFCKLLEEEGIDIEYKDGKNHPIPAIAKNDLFMRDFLREHDNPRVRALAEARLSEKSTLLQTRAETLGWVASRGPAPVYLHYSGAGTLRPSGGDGCNWLNFKRGSPIRRAVKAPQGFYLAPVDASQIECRVLHYLAGGPDDSVIQQFRNGHDPYVDVASLYYQETIYKPKSDDPRYAEMTAKRGMGKQGRLMCLGYDTKVLTARGVVPIIEVRPTDFLWDGIEWVSHRGLIYQGEQHVVEIKDVKMTSDHLILCGLDLWLPAAALQNDVILSQALEAGRANLPSSVLNLVLEEDCEISLLAAHAERPNIPSIQPTFLLDEALDAEPAQRKCQDFGQKNIMDMPTYARTMSIAADFWDASELSLLAANHQIIMRTIDMADEASKFTNLGAKIVENFWLIWYHSKAGTIQIWNLIVKIMIVIMRRVICDSQVAKSITETDEPLQNSNKKISTYDLSFAGPRNRFTVLSNKGPLIVHNCGYGASGKMFKATAASGTYGPRVDMTLEEAERFVSVYRSSNPSICARNTGYWAQCERVLARLAGGEPMDFGPMRIESGRIWIQGCPMIYDTIEYFGGDSNTPKTGWRVKKRDGWRFIWGSKLTQNICEGVSRMIVSQAMIRIKKKYNIRTLNWPYDELLLLIPRDGREEENLQLCISEMTVEPDWLPGLPLAAEGALGERYEK